MKDEPPSETAKAPLSPMIGVNRQLWEQTRERALKVADLEARLAESVPAAEHARVNDNLHSVHTATLHRTNAERAELEARIAIEQQARVDALTLAASWEKRAEAAEKERDDALEAESAISECQAQAELAERARVQALDACDEKIRAAFIFERARVNGWWTAWTAWTDETTTQEREAGIASGAPAPKDDGK